MKHILIAAMLLISLNACSQTYGWNIRVDPTQDPDTANIGIIYPEGNGNLTGRMHFVSYETLADSLENYMDIGDTDWLKYRTGTTPNNTDTMYHVGVATVGEDSVYTSTNILTGKLNVVGRLDLRFGEVQDYNIMIGKGAGRDAMTGANNIGIGASSLVNLTTGQQNIAIGSGSGGSITSGQRNFSLGQSSLSSVTTTSDNTAVGTSALNSYTGSRSTALGSNALVGSDTGNDNVGVGYQAGQGLTTGSLNTFIGTQSGITTDGSSNVMLGYQSGRLNEGSGNVFLGKESGENETGDNLLYVDNSNTTTPLIKGDFAADTLRINGGLSIRDITAGSSTDNTLGWNSSTKKVTIKSDDFLVYTALITQTGTNAPTATVLKNTLGGTVVWSYNGVGDYTATLSGVFTANMTTVVALSNNISTAKEASGVWDTASTINLYTTDAWDSANGILNLSFFEIRVYQ